MLSARTHLTRLVGVQVVTVAGAAAVSLLAANGLGPEGRGVLGLGIQFSYFSSWLVLVGIERAIPERAAGLEWTEASALALRLIAFRVLLLAFGAMIGLGMGLVGGLSWSTVLGLGLVHCVFISILACIRVSSAAAGVSRPVEVTAVTYAVLSTAACLGLIRANVTSAEAWILYLTLAACAPAVGSVLYVGSKTGGRFSTPIDGARRSANRHALGSFAMIFVTRGYRIMMVPLAGASELGLYLAIATLCDLAVWPVLAAFEVGLPRAIRAGGLARHQLLFGLVAGLLAFSAAVPILLRLGDALIVPLLGEPFAPASDLLLPLLIGAGAFACGRMLLLQVLSTNQRGARWFEGAIVAAWTPCFVILTLSYGAVGAAWSKAAVLTILGTVAGFMVFRKVQDPAAIGSIDPLGRALRP